MSLLINIERSRINLDRLRGVYPWLIAVTTFDNGNPAIEKNWNIENQMNLNRKVLVCLPIVNMLLLSWGGPPAYGESPMPVNKVPGTVENKARRLMNSLKKTRV